MVKQPAPSFGSLLRANRRSRGLSQTELGGDRYSGSYISHLESGRRQASPEVIEFLARQLSVPASELGLVEQPDPLASLSDRAASLADLLVAERAWSAREWGAASDLAGRAAESASHRGDRIGEWSAGFLQARAAAAGGHYGEAAAMAQRLADDPVAEQSSTLRAQALSLAATAYRSCDELAAAITCGAQAVELSVDAPPIVLAEALMSLVSAMLETGRTSERTERFCRRLSDVALHVESEQIRGMIAWTLGTAAYRRGEAARGRELHLQALSLLDANRDLRTWLRLHRVIATSRLSVGEGDGVAELLSVARRGLDLVGNPYDLFELAHAEAAHAVHEGRWAEAESIVQRALGDSNLRAPASNNGRLQELLGDIHRAQGRAAAAGEAYRAAAAIYDQQGHFQLANACWRLALEGAAKSRQQPS